MNIPHIKYHPSNSSKWLIEIIDLESLYKRRDALNHNPEKPHRMGFHMIIFIEQGQGNQFIDFTHRYFDSSSFIFLRKNQVNAFDLTNRPKGKAILFTDEFMSHLQENMKTHVFSPIHLNNDYSPVFVPSELLLKSCKNLLLEIEKETNQDSPNSLISMFLFSSLLLMIEKERGQCSNQVMGSNRNEKFILFTELLEQKFTQTRNALDYAKQLNITYKTLNQLCKTAANKTAKQLIDAYIILEAKRRLILENKSIQELSDELGFDETTNFVKYFKKHTLLTPFDFKK